MDGKPPASEIVSPPLVLVGGSSPQPALEITDRLFPSPHPVRHHLHTLYAELDIPSRAQPHQLDQDDDPSP